MVSIRESGLFQRDVLDNGLHLRIVDGAIVERNEQQTLLCQFGVKIACRFLRLFDSHIVGQIAEFHIALVSVTSVHIARISLCRLTGSVGIRLQCHGAP